MLLTRVLNPFSSLLIASVIKLTYPASSQDLPFSNCNHPSCYVENCSKNSRFSEVIANYVSPPSIASNKALTVLVVFFLNVS